MSLLKAMAGELEREAATTRKLLERLPDEKFDWKPHEKSMSLGQLGSHIAEVLIWVDVTLLESEYDIPSDYQPLMAENRKQLLEKFDRAVASAKEAFEKCKEEALGGMWTLKAEGKTLFSMPRMAVMRSFVLNHLVHHRGQLSVYLRLNDLPVPAIYGPSADEEQ